MLNKNQNLNYGCNNQSLCLRKQQPTGDPADEV